MGRSGRRRRGPICPQESADRAKPDPTVRSVARREPKGEPSAGNARCYQAAFGVHPIQEEGILGNVRSR
jgi:hypothetical protein